MSDCLWHELDGDEDDEELDDQLHAEFSAEFDRVQSELVTAFGVPVRTGSEDDSEIPPLHGKRCGVKHERSLMFYPASFTLRIHLLPYGFMA
jgi:hypothetical protein